MFGAIIFLPLYLQVVHNATPTSSGLELLPVVTGMLLTFIFSGRLVSRTGRYKIFPIIGTAVMTVGLGLLAQLTTATTYPETAVDMFVVGLGLGLVMQVLVVAVQNTVPHARLGTATSTATFFRTIGGAFGVSILGAIFNNRLIELLRSRASAPVLKLIASGSISANPAQINHLPRPERLLVVGGFAQALQFIYEVAVPFGIVAFLMCWLLKETPLRTTAFVATSARESTNGGDEHEPTDEAVELPTL
jgi:MFS family permease